MLNQNSLANNEAPHEFESLEIKDFLAPTSKELTDIIICSSSTKLLENFLSFCRFLLSMKWIRNQYGSCITDCMERMRTADVSDVLSLMESPIFRGWYSNFGKISDFEEAKIGTVQLLEEWNNSTFTNRFDSMSGLLCSVNARAWTSDPDMVFEVGKLDCIWFEKTGNIIRIFDRFQRTLLLELAFDQQSKSWRHINSSNDHKILFKSATKIKHTNTFVRNDIPPLCLGFTGNLDRENAISNELDFSGESYKDDFEVEQFTDAADMIRSCWMSEFTDFARIVRVVVPREVPPGWRARRMTVSSYQGCIWIMSRGLPGIFENLIHEMSHVKLRYIEEFIPILETQQTSTRYQVGWRTDPRPIVGIYEGVYVHLHMMMGWKRLREVDSMIVSDVVNEKLLKLATEVREGLTVLEDHAKFSAAGIGFVEWCREAFDKVSD